MVAKYQQALQLRGFHQGRLSFSKRFLKMSADGYSSWTVRIKCFSKLRGAAKHGCGVMVLLGAAFGELVSAVQPPSKSRFMMDVMVELSEPQRLRAVNTTAHADHVNNNVFAEMPFPISLDVGLAIAANHTNSECSQACWIVRLDNLDRWQQRVIRADVRRVFGGLFDGFHFLFATSVVERTDNYGLSKKDVAG